MIYEKVRPRSGNNSWGPSSPCLCGTCGSKSHTIKRSIPLSLISNELQVSLSLPATKVDTPHNCCPPGVPSSLDIRSGSHCLSGLHQATRILATSLALPRHQTRRFGLVRVGEEAVYNEVDRMRYSGRTATARPAKYSLSAANAQAKA